MPKAAKVTRGVMVRGKAHAEGTILPIVPHPKDQSEITAEEYTILKHTNYVEAHEEAAVAPGAPAQPQAAGKK